MTPTKYNAKKVEIDGITFHSQAEGRRYVKLREMERQGQIVGIQLQPKWPLVVNGVKVCSYIGDFAYSLPDQTFVVEDVKGVLTPTYRLKKKLMKALHGIEIVEVKA